MSHVYFDHNASTPLDERVRAAMLPWLGQQFGNASSRHEFGRQARRAVETARQQVAAAVGAHPTEVVFTSGGSEANNLFLKGAAARLKPAAVVVSAVEHPSVLEPARQLVRQGWNRLSMAVDGEGRVQESLLAELVGGLPKTSLVSIMSANNETGVVQDIAALAAVVKPSRAWFHTDAVQALGKLPLDFRQLNAAGVQAMTLSAHKVGGPIGAGALVLDKRLDLAPLIAGGGQERGLRAGTENVAALVGFGLACELAAAQVIETAARLEKLRCMLEAGLMAAPVPVTIFGAGARRLANTSFFAVAGIDGDTLVAHLDQAGFAVASGSACSSTSPEPSHVLLAMGVAPELAQGAVRVSLGRDSREQDVESFIRVFGTTLLRLKQLTAMAV